MMKINIKKIPPEDGTEFTAGMPTREKQTVDITSEDDNKTFIEESNEPILNDEKAIREVLHEANEEQRKMMGLQTHDSVANASYTLLAVNRTVAKTVVVSEHCNVDIDAEGYPVGIEVLFRTPHQTENNKTSEVNN